jgi:serine/threonine-protein kinase
MATVHLGRPIELPRAVALKQLRPELSHDRAFVTMFLDEIQLLSRVRHKNVVAPIEHVHLDGELYIVMEYIEGASLAELCAGLDHPVPERIASRIVSDVLAGLGAAHDALDPAGQPLGIVHRDISPHNVLVGTDGAARLADFGVAKAAWRAHVTQHGERKGKPGYMAPEQRTGGALDRRADFYATGIVLGELLTGRSNTDDARRPHPTNLAEDKVQRILARLAEQRSPLEAVVARALAPDPSDRFADAKSMATAILSAVPPAHDHEVGEWVARLARSELERKRRTIEALDRFVAELGSDGTTSSDVALLREDPPRKPRQLSGALGALSGSVLVLGVLGLAALMQTGGPPVASRSPIVEGSSARPAQPRTAAPLALEPARAPVPSANSREPPPRSRSELEHRARVKLEPRARASPRPPPSPGAEPAPVSSARPAQPYDPLQDERRR